MTDDIADIKKRNVKVEADKAWETSWTRRLIIAVITYIVAVTYMRWVGLSSPFFGALIPTGGYLLSTLSLPFMKNFWIDNLYKKKDVSS